MTKKKRNIIIGCVTGGIFLLLLFLWIAFKDDKENKAIVDMGTGQAPLPSQPHTDTVDENRVLSKGLSGATIVALQKAVNEKIVQLNIATPKLVADGIYGSATEAAIKAISGGALKSGNVTIAKIKAIAVTSGGGNPATYSSSTYFFNGQSVVANRNGVSAWNPSTFGFERVFALNEYLGVITDSGFKYLTVVQPSGKKYLVDRADAKKLITS